MTHTRKETKAMLLRANDLVVKHDYRPTSEIHRDATRGFGLYNLGRYDEAYEMAHTIVKFLNGGEK